MARLRDRAPGALAVIFLGSGILHLIRPEPYRSLVPRAIPAPNAMVVASGVAELICAAGLLRQASWAAPASVGLLLAIFPANVSFAIDTARDRHASPLLVAAAWGRLPLQLPMIWAALQVGRE